MEKNKYMFVGFITDIATNGLSLIEKRKGAKSEILRIAGGKRGDVVLKKSIDNKFDVYFDSKDNYVIISKEQFNALERVPATAAPKSEQSTEAGDQK